MNIIERLLSAPKEKVSQNDPGVALYKEHAPLMRCETEINHRVNERRRSIRLLPKNGVGAEIGVFTGLFSPVLFEVAQPTMLYLVDPWDKLFGDFYPAWGAYTAHGELSTEYAKKATRLRTAHIGDKVRMVVDSSLNWLPTLPDAHLDWVYLDSSHAYDETLAELEAIASKLRPGGVILCDDVRSDPSSKHHSAFRAVRDFMRRGEFEIFHLDSGQGALRRSVT